MKNKKNFINNSIWIISGNIVQMILTLVIGAISARYLGPSNYGLINYSASYTALFTPIITLGLYGIIVNEIVKCPNKDGIILGSTIVMRLIAGFISSILIILIVIFVNPDNELLWVITFLECISIFFQWSDIFNYWCQANYNSKVAVCIQLCAYIVSSGYKIYLLMESKSVEWFAFSMGLNYIIQAFLYLIYFKYNGVSKLKFSMNMSKKLLSKSHHYIYSSLASVIYGQTDRIMLGILVNEITVGLYTAATTISSMWTFILSAIIDSTRPVIISTKQRSETLYKKRIVQLYSFIIYLSLFVSLVICLFSKYIILIIYGGEYLSAQITLCVLTWGTSFSFLGVARSIWCICEDKQKYEKYLSSTGAVLNLVLNLILIPKWSINGAAIATIVTQVFTNFIIPFFIKDMRENSLFILKGFNIKNIINKETITVLLSRGKLK